MTTRARILFGTLTGALVAGSVATELLVREHGIVTDDRDRAYAQVAYLLTVLSDNGIDVNLYDGLVAVAAPTSAGRDAS